MSAKKRTSLEAVFGAEESPAVIPAASNPGSRLAAAPVTEGTLQRSSEERAGGSRRPNVKQHTAYVPLPGHEQLRKLAFEENRKIHDYFMEGLDLVFAARGLPSLKDLS